jgi:nicotinate-nucleotide adenylyltransferase
LRLAIFGGTFDPIHKAHVAMAEAAADRFRLDRVLVIPAANPPHKTGATFASYDDRLRMVELACADDPRLEVSRLEAGTERSYSINTIEEVRAQLAPNDELFFIIGADAFAEIQTWHRWRDVVGTVTFIVVSRPGHVYAVPDGAHVERFESLDLPVSSSDIRRSLAAGTRPVEVSDRVFAYIQQRGLYHFQPAS